MNSTISNTAAAGMEKSGPEFYAFMAVCLILGLVGLVLWFQARTAFQKVKEAGFTRDPENKGQWIAPERRQSHPACDICPELKGIEAILGQKIDGMKNEVLLRIQVLENNVEKTEERQEGRLVAIERKMDEGFRAVHDRIDKHLEAHRLAN